MKQRMFTFVLATDSKMKKNTTKKQNYKQIK